MTGPLNLRKAGYLGSLVLLFSGCASQQHILTTPSASMRMEMSEPYQIAFPDEVELQVSTRPELSGKYPISPEGRIELPILGNPRIEGETIGSLAKRIAELASVSPDEVQGRIIQYRSRMIYVYGPVKGPPRSIPYQGPEDVLSFLKRIGGVEWGAALRKVHVVRSNLSIGQPPQLFDVNLYDIVQKGDQTSNVILHPLDEVYVTETKRSILFKLLPDWLKLRPSNPATPTAESSPNKREG